MGHRDSTLRYIGFAVYIVALPLCGQHDGGGLLPAFKVLKKGAASSTVRSDISIGIERP